jgi:hypothetical protein
VVVTFSHESGVYLSDSFLGSLTCSGLVHPVALVDKRLVPDQLPESGASNATKVGPAVRSV